MIFEKILTLSIAGTGALLLSAVFTALGRRILSERLKYLIAVLPILFFLLPVNIGISFRIERYIEPQAEQIEAAETVEGTETDAVNANAEAAVNPSVSEPISEKTRSVDIWLILSCVWAAGVGSLLIKRVYDTVRFSRICREIAIEPPEDIRAVFERIKGKTKAELKCFNGAATPFTAGIFRPTVYVPSVKLSESELEAVLLHELTHVRRRDMLIKTAAELIKIMHFFNPAAYLLPRRVDTYCELSCDEIVMKTFSDERRRDYGRLILGLMREGGVNSGMCLCGSEKNLKRRIGNMMKTRKSTKFTAALGVCLTTAMIMASAAFAGGVNSDEAQIKILETDNFTYADFAKGITVIYDGAGDPSEAIVGDPAEFPEMCHADGKAVIVHSPVYTGFSADFKAYTDEAEPEYKEAQFEVKMTKYIRTFTDGSDVEGLFTVKQDGAVLGENLHGYINNIVPIVPTFTQISVSVDVNGTPLEFRINAEENKNPALLFSINQNENLELHPDSVLKTYDNITYQPFVPELRTNLSDVTCIYNAMTGECDFSAALCGTDTTYGIFSYGDAEISGNTIKSSFYIALHSNRVDSFEGIITMSGDKLTLVSDDGKYRIEAEKGRTVQPWNGLNVITADGSICWPNLIELRKKGEELTWSDFEDYKGEDVSSITPDSSQTTIIYKIISYGNKDYQVILKGSKNSQPSITLQNADTGAVMDLRGDGSIYDFVAAN